MRPTPDDGPRVLMTGDGGYIALPLPGVTVRLVGEDGNAFSIIGRVQREIRRAGYGREVVDAFKEEATSGDYSNLLSVCMDWVEVE